MAELERGRRAWEPEVGSWGLGVGSWELGVGNWAVGVPNGSGLSCDRETNGSFI